MKQKKVLVIEDDADLARMIGNYLSREKYDAVICGQGNHALNVINQYQPDMILLDIMLPGLDGLEILKQIRAISIVPIIIISAKETEVDRIIGLKLGADDYVTKPFSVKELIVRVESLFRRIDYLKKPVKHLLLYFGDIEIDLSSRIVTKNEKIVHLTLKEFDVLAFLVKNAHQVLSKEKIYQHVWGINEFGDINTVVIHIQKLREKLALTPFITTIRGVGYRFDGEVNEK
ncbi:DNA-binding response regulator [Bacillus sp. J14TS2]|uniref:response regulator transcription factor n=1 Tax=Bacillus sp. J14TS2 TaxID=2807188 RepID=UPI001B246481|nr:response regulator transcription factor [Bacillus sp. J14TS2]GIN73390.1 DNA-binding response regulator [Bacillus sp. J14TS2]